MHVSIFRLRTDGSPETLAIIGMFYSALTGFDNENQMVERIQQVCLEKFCPVIGGAVFTNLRPGNSALPKDVRYKLRIRLHSDGEVSATYAVLPYLKLTSPRIHESGGKFRMMSTRTARPN